MKITHEFSDHAVVFLDVEISKGDTLDQPAVFRTNLHQKFMNQYLYIPPPSFHPTSIYRAFINAELRRFRLICCSDILYSAAVDKFIIRLFRRGYNPDLILDVAKTIPLRAVLLEQVRSPQARPSSAPPILFKTTWNPRHLKLNIGKALDYRQDIDDNSIVVSVFNSRRPLMCYKRAPNLRDFLAPSRYKHNITVVPSHEDAAPPPRSVQDPNFDDPD
jgi:hypothetical protein